MFQHIIFNFNNLSYKNSFSSNNTVKHAYKDYPWDPKTVAVVDRWSMFGGYLSNKSSKWDLEMVVVIDRWSLFVDGR